MSALGQKQTYAPQNGMSALPPKADIHTKSLFQLRLPELAKSSNLVVLG